MRRLYVGGGARRGWVSTLLLFAALGASPPALAQESPEAQAAAKPPSDRRRVLVGKLSGAKTDSAREWIVQAFEADGGYELVPDDQALGLKTGASEEEILAAAAAETADVVVLGRSAFKNKAGWVAELEVYEGSTGKLIQNVEVTGKTFETYQTNLIAGEALLGVTSQAQGWPRPEPVVEEEAAPPAAEPAPVVAPIPVVPPAPAGNPEWHSPLRLLVGTRLISRSFRYTDALSDLRPTLGALKPANYPRFTPPMPRAEVRWYPAGHFTEKWPSQIGIVAGYEVAVGARLSYDNDGDGTAEPVNETHDFWYAGLRGRIPIGNVALGLQVDYGAHRLSLSGDEGPSTTPGSPGLPAFPDVAYSELEIGGDFEWRVEQLIVGLHGSYNVLLGVGEIGESIAPPATNPWFPGTQGTAVDFGAYAGWRLSPVFDVLVGLDLRAYGLDFGPVPFDVDYTQTVVAGGAIDRYMSAWLALVIKLPAKRPAAVATDAAAPGSSAPAAGAEDDFGSFD